MSKTETAPLDMTQKEFDELYPAYQMSQGQLGQAASFREFVIQHRQQQSLNKASLWPPGIRIIS